MNLYTEYKIQNMIAAMEGQNDMYPESWTHIYELG